MINTKEFTKVINDLGKNLIRDGIINTANKTRTQIQSEINLYLSKNLSPIEDLELSIDYRQGLLVNARFLQKRMILIPR